MSGGANRNLGPRLIIILIGLGVVVLGAYPIKKHYGGARGLLQKAFPAGTTWSLPDIESIRRTLLTLDEQRRRGNSENGREVATVKLSPDELVRVRGSEPSLFARLGSWFSTGTEQGGSDRSGAQREQSSSRRARDEMARRRAAEAARESSRGSASGGFWSSIFGTGESKEDAAVASGELHDRTPGDRNAGDTGRAGRAKLGEEPAGAESLGRSPALGGRSPGSGGRKDGTAARKKGDGKSDEGAAQQLDRLSPGDRRELENLIDGF